MGALVPLLMILMFVDLTAAECWLAERSVYRQHHWASRRANRTACGISDGAAPSSVIE